MRSMTKRDTNIELLRILCMFGIITMHFWGHGGANAILTDVTGIQISAEFITGISRASVNCFILIGGYYLCKCTFSWRRVLRLAIQIWFYSVVIFALLVATGMIQPSFKDFFYAFFPIGTNSDAFSTEYLIMYVLSPFMNLTIAAMNRRTFKALLSVLIVSFVVLPDIFVFLGETIPFGGSHGIVWFIVLYFTGAYLRLWAPDWEMRKRLIIYLFTAALVPLSSISASLLYRNTGIYKFWEFKEVFYSYRSILVYPASIALFYLFLKVQIRSKRGEEIVHFLAPTTFGVYLIHDNRFIRPVLWKALNLSKFGPTMSLLFYWLIVTLSIFFVCVLIDKLRQQCFNRVYRMQWWQRVEDRFKHIAIQ